MDVPIKDYVMTVGDDMGTELETYKVFRLEADPYAMNKFVLLKLKACDVNVHRSGGWHWWQRLMGRPVIAGGLDLEKLRQASIAQDLFLQVKAGKPNVFLALPDEFEKLPEWWKNHPNLGLPLKLMYQTRSTLAKEEEALLSSGRARDEVDDIMASSQAKINAFFNERMKGVLEALEKSPPTRGGGAKPEPTGRSEQQQNYY